MIKGKGDKTGHNRPPCDIPPSVIQTITTLWGGLEFTLLNEHYTTIHDNTVKASMNIHFLSKFTIYQTASGRLNIDNNYSLDYGKLKNN